MSRLILALTLSCSILSCEKLADVIGNDPPDDPFPTYSRVTIGDTTWTKADSPVLVSDTLVVPAGATLAIEPGVIARFESIVPLIVEGQLQAAGTASDSIVFEPGDAGAWSGIWISGGDTSTLAFARISGVLRERGAPNVERSYYWKPSRSYPIPPPPAFLPPYGGGLSVSGHGTRVGIVDCVIRNNAVVDGAGGGLSARDSASVVLLRCALRNNTSSARNPRSSFSRSGGGRFPLAGIGSGGGLEATRARVSCMSTSITDNVADIGAAMAVRGGGIVMDDVLVRGNRATGAAVIEASWADITIEDAEIVGNASNDLVAFHIVGGCALRMRDVLIADNEIVGLAPGNTVLMMDESTAEIEHLTLAHNSVTNDSSAALMWGNPRSYPYTDSVSVMNSILWGNSTSRFYRSPIEDVVFRYSIVQGVGVIEGKGNALADPLFRDPANGDYSLLPGSPAIDAGDPSTSDEDGTRADMGARF